MNSAFGPKKQINAANYEQELKNAMAVDKNLLKELGGVSEQMDPELAAIEKEMGNFAYDPHAMSNMEADKGEDNPDLLNELDLLEDPDNPDKDPNEELAEINAGIKENHGLAVKHKQTDKKLAIEHLQKMKAFQAQKVSLLKRHPELAPKAAPKQSAAPSQPVQGDPKAVTVVTTQKALPKVPIPKLGDINKMEPEDIEDTVHNLDKMGSFSVMQNEIKLMDAKINMLKKKNESPEYYDQKKEILESRIELLQGQVQTGLYSLEKYKGDIDKAMIYENSLLEAVRQQLADTSGHIRRIKQRIQLMEEELAQQPGEDDEEDEEEEEEEKVTAGEPPTKELRATTDQKAGGDQERVIQKGGEVRTATKGEEEQLLRRQTTFDPAKAALEEEEQEIDWSIVDKEQYDEITARFEEYRFGAQYFVQLGNREQAAIFLKSAERLDRCLKFVRQGKKLDLLKIPSGVTPAMVMGFDNKTRTQKFTELIDMYNKEFADFKAKAHEALVDAKKHKSASLKQQATEFMTKAKQSAAMAVKMKTLMKDPWQPLPITTLETEYEVKERINKELNPGVVRLFFENPQNLAAKKKYFISYFLDMRENKIEGKFDIAGKEYQVDHELGKSIKMLDKKDIAFTLNKNRMLFGSYAKTTIKLPLKELGKHCEISHELIFQGKKSKHEFKVRLQIRQALRVKEEDKISYKKLVITQIPPSFKSQGVSAGVQGRVVSTTVPMEETKQSPKKSAPKTAPQKEELPPDPPLPPELPELPDNIRELDVRDPDNIGNYISMLLLDTKVKYYTEQVTKISSVGRKIPNSVKNKLTALNKNFAILRAQIENGKISESQYIGFLKMQVSKDENVIGYLEKFGQHRKIALIKERLEIVKQELSQAPGD